MPGPGPRGMREKQRAENPIATSKRLLSYMTNHASKLIFILILTVVSALASTASTYVLKDLINNGINALVGKELTNEALQPFYKCLIWLATFYAISIACSAIVNVVMTIITNKTLNRIRNELFTKMQQLPLKYFDSHTHGELMAYYTSDVGAVRDMVSDTLISLVNSFVTIISIVVAMLTLSPLMTITVFALTIFILFFSKFVMGKSIKNFKEQQEAISKLNGYLEEMMNGEKVIKVFTHEEEVMEEFSKINNRARSASTKANIYGGVMGPVSNNMSHINYAACSILGAILILQGKISLGDLVAFLSYTRKLSDPLSRIMQKVNSILNAIAGAERIFKVIDMQPEVDEGNVTLVYATYNDNNELVESTERTGLWAWKKPTENGYEYIRLRGDVKFEMVDFSYDGKKIVLEDVNFYAKPGQKIAFVGATGAGKTTITNLINRFYDIQDGQILYDGINVKDIKKASLRSSLSMVLQDTHLFTGTVMENIRYGRLDATDEQCIEAAKLANADEFITMLPEGYNTVLTEDGVNLSQGQRQLLSIARAAVCDAPVLILDEATSSIDTRTEKLIEEGMDNLMAGRTVFVIAHRLSTVRNSNAIMVLDHGKIIERGDHDDLIAQKGQYYRLYTGQFELD